VEEFKIGDVVRLKSGGEDMTVYALTSASDVETVWFDVIAVLNQFVFPQGVLRAINPTSAKKPCPEYKDWGK